MQAIDRDPQLGYPIHQILLLRSFVNAAEAIDSDSEKAQQEALKTELGSRALKLRRQIADEAIQERLRRLKGS